MKDSTTNVRLTLDGYYFITYRPPPHVYHFQSLVALEIPGETERMTKRAMCMTIRAFVRSVHGPGCSERGSGPEGRGERQVVGGRRGSGLALSRQESVLSRSDCVQLRFTPSCLFLKYLH